MLTFPHWTGFALVSLVALGSACGPASSEWPKSAAKVSATPLLITGETILGQPISYPQTSTSHVTVDARFHGFSGSGRYAGVTGEGTFEGRRLEPIDQGGTTHVTGTPSIEAPG